MRRAIAFFMLISLLLIFAAGCKKENPPATNPTSSTQPTTPTTTVDVMPMKQVPMIAVSMPVVTEEYAAPDGTVVFTSTYQNMSLITEDPEVADKVIIDYLNEIEKFTSETAIKQAKQQALNSYDQLTDKTGWTAHTLQLTFGVGRIDSGVLSLLGKYVTYTGGAHAEIHNLTLNYDLVTGGRISLLDVLDPSINDDYILALVLKYLKSYEGHKDLFENYESIVKDRFKNNLVQENGWYFSNGGLSFRFSRYEIAPYSAGEFPLDIPYSELTGVLKDEYFPAERQEAGGTVQVSPFDEKTLDQYTQFAELIIEEGADKILLYSEKGVYDILIKTVDVSNNNMQTPYTVFASYALTPGDAIMIDSVLNTKNPGLVLFYTSTNSNLYNLIVPEGDYLVTPDEHEKYFESNS